MNKLLFALGITLIAGYCTPKMKLPPEPEQGPPPESTYTFVEEIPTSSFNRVVDIDYGTDGYLYVLDSSGIHKLFGNGQEKEFWMAQGNAIDYGASNRLVVANDTIVVLFDTDGSPVDSFPIGVNGHVVGVTIGESGEIYVSHPDTLPSQDFVLMIGDSIVDTILTHGDGILFVDYPRGIEFVNGILYVAVSHHNWVEGISMVNGPSNVLHLGGLTQSGGQDTGLFYFPIDVAVDEDGFVYVADSGNARVQVFRPDGSFLTMVTFGSENEYPVRLTVSSTGKYLFILTSEGRILKYNRVEKPPPPGGGT